VPGLPVYDGTHVADLLVAVAAGVVAAIVVAAVRLLALRIDERGKSVPLPALLLGGGLAVGLAAELADVLGADSQQVLFSGQTAIPDLVAEGSAGIVLLLLVAKGFAYAVSLGCGFRGGPVFRRSSSASASRCSP
jgi:H+/Cl- antiporter ClcA